MLVVRKSDAVAPRAESVVITRAVLIVRGRADAAHGQCCLCLLPPRVLVMTSAQPCAGGAIKVRGHFPRRASTRDREIPPNTEFSVDSLVVACGPPTAKLSFTHHARDGPTGVAGVSSGAGGTRLVLALIKNDLTARVIAGSELCHDCWSVRRRSNT